MAVLEPGICGTTSGQLVRPQRICSLNGYKNNDFGYVIWYPSFTNDGNESTVGTNCNANMFVWGTADPNLRPTMSGFGYAGSPNTSTIHSMTDPAFPVANSSQVEDHRNIAGCLKVSYIGQQSGCTGTLVPLTNIPLEVMYLAQGRAAGLSAPTVNELMAYAQNKPVRPLDGLEIKWRPQSTQSALTYRTPGETPFACAAGNPTVGNASHETSPTGIGFIWYNGFADDLLVESVKIIEYRTTPFSGLMAASPKGSDNPGIMSRVISMLDAKFPDWQITASAYGVQAVSNLMSNLALAGTTGAASRAAPLLLM